MVLDNKFFLMSMLSVFSAEINSLQSLNRQQRIPAIPTHFYGLNNSLYIYTWFGN